MEILLYAVGIILMAIAIAVSIALHEVGHLVPAKLFNVRVPQYMIGFGKTVFSFRRGETEYGFKAIPLGGYISMIGMYPPSPAEVKEHHEEGHSGSTSPFASLAEEARAADAERMQPGDENRLFYKLPVLKRMVIMLGGPTMNLLIGVVCTAILVCGFGTAQVTNKVSAVSECVPSVSVTHDSLSYGECTDKSTPSPAKAAGVQVGDRVVAVNGASTGSWEAVSSAIRAAGSHPSTLTVERNGQRLDLSVTPVEMVRPVSDGKGQYARAADGSIATTRGGFVGISPSSELVPGSITEVPGIVGDTLGKVGSSMLSLPQRVWDLAVTLVTGGERSAESPVSVVGVSRIAGEVTATDRIDVKSKAAMLVSLVANMNLMLFAFNLIPLLPLDGGHVLGALWEGMRRFFARLTGRKDPGPFDPVKLLPLTYVVAGAFILMSVVLIIADVVKPITLF